MLEKKYQEICRHLGHLLKNASNCHNIEFERVFTLNENTYFQKMISEEILKKGPRIRPQDYLKSLAFLEYHGSIIENDYTVSDNLVTISKALRKTEREKGEDGMASYLNLKTVIIESALFTKERLKKQNKKSITLRGGKEIEKRYLAEPVIDLTSETARKPDLYYEAIGTMMCDFISKKNQYLLERTKRKTELEAMIFTDSILPILTNAEAKTVYDHLLKYDYFNASISAFNKLIQKVNKSDLESVIFRENGTLQPKG